MKMIQNAKFALGRVLATPGALEALQDAEAEAVTYLQRHALGDWGDLSKDDLEENELSLREGFRLLSAYHLPDSLKSGSSRKLIEALRRFSCRRITRMFRPSRVGPWMHKRVGFRARNLGCPWTEENLEA